MSKFIRPKHLPVKRGKIVETETTKLGGTLKRYASGYIEHVDKDGRKTDVLWDLHRRVNDKRTWKCTASQGGAQVTYENVTRSEAVGRCSMELGGVIHVDDYHGFIFYKERSVPAVSLTPPLP